MRAILDSCVAIKTVLPEEHSEIAARLRDEYVRGIHELLAPDVLPVEFAHAITRAHRRGIISNAEATLGMRDFLQVLPELHESILLLPRAFEISLKARIGVYDCLYLALAEREGIPVITTDGPLSKAPGYTFIPITDF